MFSFGSSLTIHITFFYHVSAAKLKLSSSAMPLGVGACRKRPCRGHRHDAHRGSARHRRICPPNVTVGVPSALKRVGHDRSASKVFFLVSAKMESV